MSEQNQGSFLGGLALGLFAGAAGYFLFATKDGAKIRRDVEKEWQSAKISLAEEGLIADKDLSISQMISDWLGLAEDHKQTKKKTPKPTAGPSTKKPKFKGV